jgi:NADH-quinone oxidoreductase subunit G
MPTIEIDGRTIETEAGLTIIAVADRLDIEIPHYCYHPGLSIAGNCRMCLVEIERMPRLQIACNTPVMDGMVVRTATPKVEAARRAVLEFLLLNHPIDCPVCDQAGECKLQDYYMDFGRYPSRVPLEAKVRKGKVMPIGSQVVLDQERCILCTRCVRFLDEVTHTSELGIFERGDHCVIDLAPGRRLDNPYSANVVDVCPVGALTSTDFRFAARVWYLERAASVCTACSRGCSIDVYHRRGEILRFRPRYNPEVNRWWMCDHGRMSYRALQGSDRLTASLIRGEQGFAPADLATASAVAAARLKEVVAAHGPDAVAGVVSARATNEEMFLLTQLLRVGVGTSRVSGVSWSPTGATGDDLLIRADKNPNGRGLELLGLTPQAADVERLVVAVEKGDVRALVLLRSDLASWVDGPGVRSALETARLVIVLDSVTSETAGYADVVLAIGTHIESDGTFTNCDGQVQRAHAVFPPPGEAAPGWQVLSDLARRLGVAGEWSSAAAVFDALGRQEGPFRGFTFDGLGVHGCRVPATQTCVAGASG